MIFTVLHQLVVVFNRNFLVVSLLTKVIKDLISDSVAQSLMVVTVQQEGILIVCLRISFI